MDSKYLIERRERKLKDTDLGSKKSKYKKLRDMFLKKNPNCKVCGRTATEVHHKKGRVGDDFTDLKNFLPVCRSCHRKIEDNPKWAKENGYSENRIS